MTLLPVPEGVIVTEDCCSLRELLQEAESHNLVSFKTFQNPPAKKPTVSPDYAGHLVRSRLVGGQPPDLRLRRRPRLLVVVLARDLEVVVARSDDGAQPGDVVGQHLRTIKKQQS